MNRLPASRARLWAAATVLLGAGMASRPEAVGRWAAGANQLPPPDFVVRILGARGLVQGIAVALHPTRTMIGLGSSADLSHAITMAAAAGLVPRYRRSATVSGVLAAASAAIGISLGFTGRTR